MRRIASGLMNEGQTKLVVDVEPPIERDEVIMSITGSDIVIIVDALWARAQTLRDLALLAYLIEGEEPDAERVQVLHAVADEYSGLASSLILHSPESWKTSDNRHPEREAFEIGRARLSEYRERLAEPSELSTLAEVDKT